jgi:hypothetical protein
MIGTNRVPETRQVLCSTAGLARQELSCFGNSISTYRVSVTRFSPGRVSGTRHHAKSEISKKLVSLHVHARINLRM